MSASPIIGSPFIQHPTATESAHGHPDVDEALSILIESFEGGASSPSSEIVPFSLGSQHSHSFNENEDMHEIAPLSFGSLSSSESPLAKRKCTTQRSEPAPTQRQLPEIKIIPMLSRLIDSSLTVDSKLLIQHTLFTPHTIEFGNDSPLDLSRRSCGNIARRSHGSDTLAPFIQELLSEHERNQAIYFRKWSRENNGSYKTAYGQSWNPDLIWLRKKPDERICKAIKSTFKNTPSITTLPTDEHIIQLSWRIEHELRFKQYYAMATWISPSPFTIPIHYSLNHSALDETEHIVVHRYTPLDSNDLIHHKESFKDFMTSWIDLMLLGLPILPDCKPDNFLKSADGKLIYADPHEDPIYCLGSISKSSFDYLIIPEDIIRDTFIGYFHQWALTNEESIHLIETIITKLNTSRLSSTSHELNPWLGSNIHPQSQMGYEQFQLIQNFSQILLEIVAELKGHTH